MRSGSASTPAEEDGLGAITQKPYQQPLEETPGKQGPVVSESASLAMDNVDD